MSAQSYAEFLERKRVTVPPVGFDVPIDKLNPALFPFQKDIVRWALARGRAAIFAGTGLGKSIMQLEWARIVALHTGGPVLVLAPLAVAQQTVREGEKFGIAARLVESAADVGPGVNVTNYQKLHRFDDVYFAGVVPDESSIIKDFEGKIRNQLMDRFRGTHYRLACTATPAPNDYMELGNHAEFLGAMSRSEMLAMFFVHDGGQTNFWRLKGHAQAAFWEWVCSWAVLVRSPMDLGYQDDRYNLPPLHMHQITVDGVRPDGYLFVVDAQTLQERRDARRASIHDRVAAVAKLANADDEPWIIWCGLNAESEAIAAAIPGAVEVTGSDPDEVKGKALLDFAAGKIRVLVTKPRIAGYGMNLQVCANVAFVGLSDSWEEYYQAIRRCWRFGQTRPVHCYVITSESEGAVVANIKRKEHDAEAMASEMVQYIKVITAKNIRGIGRTRTEYRPQVAMRLPSWLKTA